MQRRHAFLAAAVALLSLAAWLQSRGDRPIKPPPRARPELRHAPSLDEQARNLQRHTLPPAPAPAGEAARPKRDPLTTALPPTSKGTVVFEAKALRESPVAKLLFDCVISKRELADLADMKRKWGFDPLADVDRFAISSESVAVASGSFGGLRWDQAALTPSAYGDHGTIYAHEEGRDPVGVWNDQILLVGPDVPAIQAAIDRLEGRAPPAPPPIPDWAAYGDVYGYFDAKEIAAILPPSQKEIADRLRSVVQNVELHVDTSEDMALTADAFGSSHADVTDLGKTLGAALSLARIEAQAARDDQLAELLELARVSPHDDGRFTLDLALPMEVLKRRFGPCPRDAERGGGEVGDGG